MTNTISSIHSTSPAPKRSRVDRFDFPIARNAFETATFSVPPPLLSLYEKTLEANLLNTSPNLLIPPQAPSPSTSLRPAQKPLRTYRALDIRNDFYLDPLSIFGKTLLLASQDTLHAYLPKTLQPQSVVLKSDSNQIFTSIKANPFFPVAAARTASSTDIAFSNSLLMVDLEAKKNSNELDLAPLRREFQTSRGSSISWRDGREFATPIGNECLLIDSRIWKPHKLSLEGHPPEDSLFGIDWNHDGQFLATGSSEGAVRIYDIRILKKCLFNYKHGTATVKALAWHPTLPILASGGGSYDRFLKMVDLRDQTQFTPLYTEAQVASLVWLSKQHLLAGYGFGTSTSNLGMFEPQSPSIIPIEHPSHPSMPHRRIWTTQDSSPEIGLSYYTLNGLNDASRKGDYTYLSRWFIKKQDPLKRKAFEITVR